MALAAIDKASSIASRSSSDNCLRDLCIYMFTGGELSII